MNIQQAILAALPCSSFLALLDACPDYSATELDSAARRMGVQCGDAAPYHYAAREARLEPLPAEVTHGVVGCSEARDEAAMGQQLGMAWARDL